MSYRPIGGTASHEEQHEVETDKLNGMGPAEEKEGIL